MLVEPAAAMRKLLHGLRLLVGMQRKRIAFHAFRHCNDESDPFCLHVATCYGCFRAEAQALAWNEAQQAASASPATNKGRRLRYAKRLVNSQSTTPKLIADGLSTSKKSLALR